MGEKMLRKIKVILKIILYGEFFYRNKTRPQVLGNKIVVLGNGNSAEIYKKNRNKFKDYDLLVVNFYPIKEKDFFEFKPKYLCLMDPQFFAPEDVFYHDRHRQLKDDIQKLYDALKKIDWKLTIITSEKNKGSINSKITNNKMINYIFLSKCNCGYNISRFEAGVFYRNWAIPAAQNVVVAAVYFSEVFGYKEIALFGIEQNWLQLLVVDENNILHSENEYFYGKVSTVVNSSYKSEMMDIVRTFDGFDAAKKLADYKKIKIKNYAVKSYVQCFEKIKL